MGKVPARDLKALPSSGTSESWCTVIFDDERSNGWTSPASETLTTAGSRRSPLRTPTARYGSRVTGWTAIPFITRLFAVTPSAAAIFSSIDSKSKGSSEAGAGPRSVSTAKTAPSLLSPKKRTPSGLKVRAPADCGVTWLIVFMMISMGCDRPLTCIFGGIGCSRAVGLNLIPKQNGAFLAQADTSAAGQAGLKVHSRSRQAELRSRVVCEPASDSPTGFDHDVSAGDEARLFGSHRCGARRT